MVATVTLEQGLDLGAIARSIPNVEYDPEEFPGLVLRLDNPKLTALVFGTGKMVITGAKKT
ncbi:MAG: TATA-box-binding protein, partial [Sulfolobales archaeon]